jgi:hypothetical protein
MTKGKFTVSPQAQAALSVIAKRAKSVKTEQALSFRKGGPLFRGTEPSMWDFWKHGVTSSFLGTFLSCREQTRLAFVQGWSSKTLSLAIEFGTCMHWILEQAYSPATGFMKKRKVPTVEWCKKTVAAYQKMWLKDTKDPTPKQIEQQEMVYGLAEQVAPVYFRRWDGDFTGEYTQGNNTVRPVKWVSLEEIFCVPYEYPDGKIVPLRGRRDGVFLDQRQDIRVLDTKCRSVINEQDTMDTMEHDLQQMFYLHVTDEQVRRGLISGVKKPPVGMVLNTIRRPGHRQTQGETLKVFLERVGKDIAQPKNKDYQFPRFQLDITPDEVRSWKKRVLDPIMMDVRMWWEGTVPHYLNPNSLLSKYGRCGLFLPITKGEFGMCYRRKKVFGELPEVET